MTAPPAPTPHVFLTRFNLPANRVEQSIFSPEWLEARMELFEAYTVPSVRAQDQDGLGWVVYLDQRDTPDWLRTRMSELEQELPLHPIYLDRPLDRETIRTHVSAAAGLESGLVTTSNLDNDDGLASDFVRRVRALVPASGPSAIYLTEGLILSEERVYERHDPDNAFSAVVDDVASTAFLSCWAATHHELDELMPVVREGGAPGWLQVVHGRNVSNRVGGRLVPPERHAPTFPGLIDTLPALTRRARAQDTLSVPVRAARDRVVRPAAGMARKVVGPSRYESIKMTLQQRR